MNVVPVLYGSVWLRGYDIGGDMGKRKGYGMGYGGLVFLVLG